MEYIIIYLFIALLVAIFIDTIVNQTIWYSYDEEFEELMEDKPIRYSAIAIFSLLWIMTVPILIYNQKGD